MPNPLIGPIETQYRINMTILLVSKYTHNSYEKYRLFNWTNRNTLQEKCNLIIVRKCTHFCTKKYCFSLHSNTRNTIVVQKCGHRLGRFC